MNEPDLYHWRDNMPLEEKVAILFERTGTYIRNTNSQLSEIKTMVASLLALGSSVDRQGDWQTQHSIHHGEDDAAIGRRLGHDDSPIGARIKANEDRTGLLWREIFDGRGDSNVAMLRKAHDDAQTTRGVYLSIWKVLVFVITLPITGAVVGWLGAQAGWW